MSQQPITAETFDSQKEIRKHLKILVAVVLLTLTNVGLSYAPISSTVRTILILSLAAVTAGLILSFFMHLISEGQMLFWIVIGCIAMVPFVLILPMAESFSVPEGTHHNKVVFSSSHGHHEQASSAESAAEAEGSDKH